LISAPRYRSCGTSSSLSWPSTGLDIGSVRRSHVRLGHEKRRPNAAVEQGLTPSAGLLGCAVSEDRLNVAGIWRRAIEDFRRPEHAAHDFAQRRIFEVRQRAAMRLRLPEIPQTCGARLGLELLNDRHRFPASVAGNVSLPLFLVRVDVRRKSPCTIVVPVCGGMFCGSQAIRSSIARICSVCDVWYWRVQRAI
jgi:hypothetical protein